MKPGEMFFVVALAMGVAMGPLLAAESPAKQRTREMLRQGGVVVDVRTPAEHARGRVAGSTNIPVASFPDAFTRAYPDKSKPYLLHCQSGGRSARALEMLKEQGYTNVVNLGGLDAAKKAVKDLSHK